MTHPARLAGEFSICHATLSEADEDGFTTDAFNYRTLRWNYNEAEAARTDLAKVALEEGVPVDECVVIQVHEQG